MMADPLASFLATPSKPPRADLDDVYHAYRLLLGREPDPSGLEHYARMVIGQTVTAAELASFFLGSEEFAERQGSKRELTEVQLDGYSMYVRQDDHDVSSAILRNNQYEPHVAAVVRQVLRPGDVFVDVGANIGFFTALAAHLVGSDGLVVAVEPLDKNLQLIYATVWKNRLAQARVLPYAASDREDLVPIQTNPGTSNAEIVPATSTSALPKLFAQTRTLDDLLGSLDALRLVKLDIEGHELRTWRGFSDGLGRYHPLVLSEFHPKCMRENAGTDPHEYLRTLFEYGDDVRVLDIDGAQLTCVEPADVMRSWEKANAELGGRGDAHLDLFVRPRGRSS